MTRNPENTLYTICVYSENHVGLLNKLSIIFKRRCVNIESVSACRCSLPEVHKITLTCHSSKAMVDKIIKQISKCIDVIKAFVYTDDEIVYQEVALYKVPTDRLLDEQQLEQIIRRHGARILELTRDYTVLEKTGHFYETESLFNELKRYGIVQFVRSGRVAVTKSPVELVNEYLEQRAKQSSEKF